ncbi:MAG: hypothetical protein ABIR06_13810 [Cyclobacteriaceae bacterium]
MKLTIAIVLITLLLFNVLGFYGLFEGLKYQNRRVLINRLDTGGYDADETITLSIPMVIPYSVDQLGFERVNGEFEHQGEFYRLVKQRFAKDTLFVVCVKDPNNKKIHQALKDYVKTFTDNPGNDKSSSKATPAFLKDYFLCVFSMDVQSLGWTHDIHWKNASNKIQSSFFQCIIHPPERA